MKKHNIYLKAAKRIASGKEAYTCWAIIMASDALIIEWDNRVLMKSEYELMFEHDSSVENGWWSVGCYDEETQLCRSLALLFMHEMQGEE
jgi:hypothetical protein